MENQQDPAIKIKSACFIEAARFGPIAVAARTSRKHPCRNTNCNDQDYFRVLHKATN